MTLDDLYRLLRSGHVQAQGVVDTITQPIVVLDQGLSVMTANNAFLRTFQVERDDVLGKVFFDLGDGQWNIPELRDLIHAVIPKAAAVIGFEVKHNFPTLGDRTFLVDARRLAHPDGNSTNVLILFDDVTERQRNEALKDYMIHETRHRMRNLFAVVRAVARQTETVGRTASEYRDIVLGRLDVALRAQEVAATEEGSGLQELVTSSVGQPGFGRVHCSGPAVSLDGAKVFAFSMIVHELTTNAAKYGSLSVPEGKISVTWVLDEGSGGNRELVCEWREEQGPPVQQPIRRGYGTGLIEGMAAHLGGAVELRYEPKGLVAAIKLLM